MVHIINTQGKTCFNNSFIAKSCMSCENKVIILGHDQSSVLSFRRECGNWQDFLDVCIKISGLFLNFHICHLHVGRRKKYIYKLLGLQPEKHLDTMHLVYLRETDVVPKTTYAIPLVRF